MGRFVQMDVTYKELTESVLGCAFDVHARMGPGLLESTYRSCLVHRLRRAGLIVECEVPISIDFDGVRIGTAYRADVIVEGRVLLELKAVDNILSIHLAQLRTYLEHSRIAVGLLLNFNVKSLKDGVRRITIDPFRGDALPPTPPNSFFPS